VLNSAAKTSYEALHRRIDQLSAAIEEQKVAQENHARAVNQQLLEMEHWMQAAHHSMINRINQLLQLVQQQTQANQQEYQQYQQQLQQQNISSSRSIVVLLKTMKKTRKTRKRMKMTAVTKVRALPIVVTRMIVGISTQKIPLMTMRMTTVMTTMRSSSNQCR
jgi:hypothetical protein